MNNWLSFGQHHIWKGMTIKWANPQLGDVALDLCCGSGDLTRLLAKEVGDGRVIGVDFSCELLAIAQTKTNYSQQNLEWVEADVLKLPFEDNSFDCATMGYGLRNVVDIPLCLQELHRVLKPGAKAAILDFHRPSQPYITQFQEWYLKTLVVPTAERLGVKSEYDYIAPSVERFPIGTEQVKLAYEAGFAQATHYAIALEMMGILVITKN